MAKWTRSTTLALVELSKTGRTVYIDSAGGIRCPSPSLIASRGGKPPAGWTKFVDDPRTKAELKKDGNTIARDRLRDAIAEDDAQHGVMPFGQQSLRQASRAVRPTNRKRDYRPGVRR